MAICILYADCHSCFRSHTMDIIDYRKELADARANLQYADENVYWEIICGDVLVAEGNCKNHSQTWENASLAEELLIYFNLLKVDESYYEKLETALSRMIDCIVEHPRLLLRLYESKLFVTDHDTEEINEEIRYLKQNILYADQCEWNLITNKGFLKKDPIEWSLQWEKNIDLIDKMVNEKIGEHFGMGFCHAFWHERAKLLESELGIIWRSPATMNPGCMFD